MTIVVRRAFPRGRLPEDLAAVTIDTEHFKGVFVIGTDAVRMQKLFVTFNHMLHCLSARNYCSFDSCRQKHPVAPNDRRRVRATFDRSLPLDVFGRTPFSRKVLLV